ncbi:MAG TPA: GNAT family N-acetyltransferase [Acidimicrobiales bacterium]
MDEEPLEIRPAAPEDLHQLNDLYNHYVAHSHATFDIRPVTMAERVEWFRHYRETGRHRVLVAVAGASVLGYASASPYRRREAYDTSVETTVYLAPAATGRRIGRRLYTELFRAIEGEDLHRAIAGVALPNEASVTLHERFGFSKVGHFSEQGRKFGRYWDVAYFERPLP